MCGAYRTAVGLQGAGNHRSLYFEPLPRNANGKVLKRQLREAWAAAQAQVRLEAKGAEGPGLQR